MLSPMFAEDVLHARVSDEGGIPETGGRGAARQNRDPSSWRTEILQAAVCSRNL